MPSFIWELSQASKTQLSIHLNAKLGEYGLKKQCPSSLNLNMTVNANDRDIEPNTSIRMEFKETIDTSNFLTLVGKGNLKEK